MNIANSQQFVSRCRRVLIPWFARTDFEAVRDMEKSCMGIAGGMLLTLCIASISSWSGRLAIVLFSISVAVLSLFLTFRLRIIRQFFDKAGVRSFAELREREHPAV